MWNNCKEKLPPERVMIIFSDGVHRWIGAYYEGLWYGAFNLDGGHPPDKGGEIILWTEVPSIPSAS